MTKKPSYDGYKKRLRSFPKFQGLSEIELEERARELYDDKYDSSEEENGKFIENEVGVWISPKEAKQAEELFNTYIEKNKIISFSDTELLKTLVNYEIQLKRLQNTINLEIKSSIDAVKPAPVPLKELQAINQVNIQILNLKKVLGLSDDKKADDPLEHTNALKRKMFVWAKKMYQASRFRKCPNCTKPLLLLMRPEVWEAYNHPFFKDNYLFNAHLWKLYQDKVITKEDVALVLIGTLNGLYYVEWLEKKILKENESQIKESGDQELLLESGNEVIDKQEVENE